MNFELKSEPIDAKTNNDATSLLNASFETLSQQKVNDSVKPSEEKKTEKSENEFGQFFDGFMYLEKLFNPFDDVKSDIDQIMKGPLILSFAKFNMTKRKILTIDTKFWAMTFWVLYLMQIPKIYKICHYLGSKNLQR